MTKFWVNLVLVRVLFPSLLVLGVIWRPVGLSLVYLLLALVAPFVPVPTHYSTSGPTTKPGQRFLVAGISLSCLVILAQLTFQILMFSLPSKAELLINCQFLEKLLRHVGLVKLKGATLQEFAIWLAPEIVIFPSSMAIYCISRRLTGTSPASEDDESSLQSLQKFEKKSKDRSSKLVNAFGGLGTYIVLAMLCFTASLNPSAEGGFYFLVFVLSATWWATHRELHRGFAVVCRLVMLVVGFHVVALLSYQNQWPREYVPTNGTWARYFAFNATSETNCTDPRDRQYIEDNVVPVYSYQLRLFLLYFVLGLQSSFLFAKPASDELLRFGSGRSGGLLQDSTGSVIVQDGQQDDAIQMQSLSEGAPEEQPGIVENVIMALFSIYQLISHSSYLGTNIIMMTWSIMYHSWSTFVLLLWALILWMVPNKRSSMMKCSKFIVLYTTILILIQYVYSLNLTEEELPNVIFGINMTEVGFNEPPSQSSHWHLVTKCCFLTMFWITMRQYSSEMSRQRRSSTLRDMVAPLHVSVSTAMNNNSHNQAEPEIKSKYVQEVGRLVKKFLVKFWIAAVALMLFISGFVGERMTVFRIIYMTLFLLFIITFQISWVAWKKMLYGFLVTVIGYSVIMLILVYTYQFPQFPEYWHQYLKISVDLQRDIGLITYDTKDLFVKLITPTSFVIISVIQIHYFHDDFLETTNLNKVSDVSRKDSLGHSPNAIPIVSSDEVFISQNDDLSRVFTLKELKEMSKVEMTVLGKKISGHFWNFYNYTWLFIELHIQKIIFIAFVIFCINDICAINVFFIVTVTITISFRRRAQIMVINTMASVIAILVVVKMLYQIDYIKHENWNRDCPSHDTGVNASNTTTYNMAEWIGLKKIDKDNTLSYLLKGSILLLALTTFRAMIMVRQLFYRQQKGEPLETPMFMFPEIKRADADKGLVTCFKFLCNYGFYKFGLEFCLIGMVGLIGIRLDFYSVLYSIWLMILFWMNRKTTMRIWPFLKLFALILLPLQYIMIVAPPPWLCIDYPWQNPDKVWLRSLQKFMFLPDPDLDNRPNPKKLMCDFILLMMIVRQSLVFRIEERSVSNGQEFVAGHNYSVFKEMEKPNSVNPVKDYVSHIHNWLDVLKRGCFMSLMWITLAFMFLAGTKRTNLFSLGYLIGAFVFLWQGSDFYLRPVNTILKWWNILIGYNILVIFGKAIFQGIGCVYLQNLESCDNSCWLIQLLGISCLDKFVKFEDQIKFTCDCKVNREDIGMLWDGLCFAFLIMQKRLFRSYYFFYIVDETKAMSILASRGAELLEELHQKRIMEQENLERTMLEKIKFKMDKIKENQQKLHGPSHREPKTHKIEEGEGGSREAPLARTSSMSSCISSNRTPPQGYQTPIDEDDEPAPLTPRAGSLLLQAPSPNSAIMTVSLEGYLEPGRISFGSPPSSELNPRGPSPDETFPVFSPLPGASREHRSLGHEGTLVRRHRRPSSCAGSSSWTNAPRTPRRSIVSTVSRSPRSHHTSVRSGDYYMFDDMDDDDLTDFFSEDKNILEEEEEEENRRRRADKRGRRMTISELMNALIKTDIDIATHVALYGGTEKDAMKIRRRSEPLSRKKSSMSYLSARSDTDTAAATDLPEQETRTTDSTGDDATDQELDDFDRISEESGKDKKKGDEEGEKVSFLTYFKFLWAFLNSSMVSMTKHLNSYSNDYRYIRKVLAKEKKLLKEKPDFRMGTRLGINQIWQPIVKPGSSRAENPDEIVEDAGQGSSSKENLDDKRTESSLSVPHIRILAPSLERGLDISSSSSLIAQGVHTQAEDEEDNVLSEVDQLPVIQLAASIWFGVLSHSTFLCYFMVFMHQIRNASLLSTPLPLMVFLWGSLSIPRPSKTFWITLIAYVEVIVIIKLICQPSFNTWNDNKHFKFLGVERQTNYALWELMLLLVVFFHRYMLKSLGQWTMPSIRSRKVIPSGLTIATVRRSRPDGDTNNGIDENGVANKLEITPKGRILSLHLDGEGDRLTDPLPTGDNERLVIIQATETDVIQEDFQKAVKLTTLKYWEPIRKFFEDIRDPNGKEKTNVYVYMFLCDFFNFLLLIFGFSAFGTRQGDGGVAAYFLENRIPIPFLVMLLLQFALIVVDRAFYLKKSVTNRLILHYPFVVAIHIWMFFVLPLLTSRPFNENKVLQVWYMIKCFYLLLAAYQLRLGYPTRVLGNILCKKFTFLRYVMFKVFMSVPLLFEMRAVMDWIWTDTSMTAMDWFKMEDIFANIFQIKCSRVMEDEYPQERGQKKKQISKYLVGGGALILMIGIIWFPLMIFALGNTVGRSNLPKEVTLNMRISSYEPIYTIMTESGSILKYSEENFIELKNLYRPSGLFEDPTAFTFLMDYEHTDVVAVKLSSASGKLWSISPPDRNRLKEELLSNNSMTIYVEWSVTRDPISKEVSGTTSQVRNIDLPPYLSDGSINPVRQGLLDALNELSDNNRTVESKSVLLENALPMFLKVTSRGISEVMQLMNPFFQSKTKTSDDKKEAEEAKENLYRNVRLVITNNTLNQQWFSVHETCNDSSFNASEIKIPLNDCSYIMMFMFNDKSFPEGLSFLSGMGIIGVYTTFVIFISSLIKRMVSDIAPKIMFEDLPYVDRILRLCLDIYLVRESGDLCLEEDLFAKLVFLYRSPETLIRWTRPPESSEQRGENEDDENYNEIDNYGNDVDNGDDENEEEERLQLRRRRRD
ncbi:piezo-type mechanosensitive ion channel component isoform X2 [Copidosoma floridanum]|uniref:piezo-type mechanosensitive ion channel component isoform X2 n=1 Tax=Copidosoma floridanum TaxID=29053 RepID=UPI000C6F5807|nr:piezo-type mechanosensitive ion channel component isoform X2 [Copidosoma floridanum]